MATPLQVLILEDRAEDAELLLRELAKAGYAADWQRVETEKDFRSRLTPTLQLILADYNLPTFTAPQALETLAQSGLDTPFIVVSGSVGDDRAVECLKLGATDYVLKDRLARLGPAVQRALAERAEREEMRRVQQALERSEAQMRGILSTVEDVVWSLSLETGRVIYVNPAVEKLTGRSMQHFLDDPQRWLQTVHPDDHQKMMHAQEEAVRWGTFESEYRMVHANGSVRNVVVRAWTAYQGGKPVRLEGIFTDVTDKREREKERVELEVSQQEASRLKQLDEFKTQFIGMVAHDLNNALSPLRIDVGTLRRELPAQADGRTLQRMEANISRLAAFLGDLLDASRLQSGKLALNRQSIDLAAQVRTALEYAQPQAALRHVRVEAGVPESVVLDADARRMDQVITNLLSNALKFTPEGGVVRVGLEAGGGSVLLTIADSGVGIAPEDIPKLFQPFARLGTSPQGKHTGTGLGLFICRGIVEQHGGKIWCDSRGPGIGATFNVRLPAAP